MVQVPISFAQDEDTIVLSTNKNSYIPGDTVQLNGMLTGQPGQLVAIQVKDSSGNLILIRTVQADQNGYFALQFKIPPTASSGDFSIVASAKVNGFIVTEAKTVNATVPEFGPNAAMTFGLSILLIMPFFVISSKLQKTMKKI